MSLNNEIHVLDNETIDKIAAGEVVERPSSVIKELVENAMDAGSTSITVDIENGGIEFIRVTDNGCGIDKNQMDKAFMRHATSKIKNADDLNCILSLGFRGEALSSISAVSKTEVISKTRDELTGLRYIIEGGIFKEKEEIGAPEGTTFIVRNLFYNTPVRRKFLKSEITEGNNVQDLMERFALSHPFIAFQFHINHKLKFATSGNGNLKEVIYRIYGRETVDSLIEIDEKTECININGFLGKPVLTRSNRNFETVFINGRFVKSDFIYKAIENGYSGFLMQHKFPFTVLNIEIDSTKVDVNVHPNKLDVRFDEPEKIFAMISSLIAEGLKHREMIAPVTLSSAKEEASELKAEKLEIKKEMPSKAPEPFEKQRILQDLLQNTEKSRIFGDGNSTKDSENERMHANIIKKNEHVFVEKHHQLELFEENIINIDFESQYEIIGQIFDTYWIIAYKDKVLYIDQHAAHEKVKYEEFVERLKDKEIVSEQLVPPVILKLTAKEQNVLNDYMTYFEKMGFVIEEFGGNDVAIREVPMDLYGCNPSELFIEILDELYEKPMEKTPEVILNKLASMSCKAAVKGNMRMSEAEARELIHKLLKLENPYHCPHGRPVIVSMSQYEIERKFKRIVT